MKDLFDSYDKDKSGRLEKDEATLLLRDILQSMGITQEIPQEVLEEGFTILDEDENQTLSRFEIKPIVEYFLKLFKGEIE